MTGSATRFKFPTTAFAAQATSRFQSQRVPATGERGDAQGLIASLRQNTELVSRLGEVVNTTEAEQARHANATEAVEHEYMGGTLLPAEVQAMREQLRGDPAGLELLDAEILDLIREQHAQPAGLGFAALAPAPTFQSVQAPALPPAPPAANGGVPGSDDTEPTDPYGNPLTQPRQLTDGSYEIDITFDFPTRAEIQENKALIEDFQKRVGGGERPVDAAIERIQNQADDAATTNLGMPKGCANPLFNYPLTSASGQFVSISNLDEAQQQSFAGELEPVVSRVYGERLAAQVAGNPPKTPVDWEIARRTAWREAMASSEVSSIVDRMVAAGTSPGTRRAALEDVVEAASDAGARLLFDGLGGEGFAMYPRGAASLGVDVSYLTPEQLTPFAAELSNGGLLANTYARKIGEVLASRGTPPATQDEFDAVQNEAWLATLKDPKINDVLARIQLLDIQGFASQKVSETLSLFDRFVPEGMLSGELNVDALLAGGADPRLVLQQSFSGTVSKMYESYRQDIVDELGEPAAAVYDAQLLKREQEQCRLLIQVKPMLPDLTALADAPNRPGRVVRLRDQTGGMTNASALAQSLEGKDATALLAARERVLQEQGQDAANAFDALALATLRKLTDDNVANYTYAKDDLYQGGGPRPEDIKQDGFGDCYMVAAFMALADRQPQVIRDAIQYDEATHNYHVRLYDPAGNPFTVDVTQDELKRNLVGQETYSWSPRNDDNEPLDAPPVDVTTGGGSTVDNQSGRDGATWPAVLEVAMAKSRDLNPADGLKEGYTAIANGGWASEVLRMLTGSPSTAIPAKTENAITLLEHAALGHVMTLSTPKLPQDLKNKGLVGFHAYQIDSIRQDKNGEVILTLRNPWGDSYFFNGEVQPQKIVEVKLSELAAVDGFTLDVKSALSADTETALTQFVSDLPSGRLATHRIDGGGHAKSITMSIKQHRQDGVVDFTAAVDDVYTTPGSPSGNLLPTEFQDKRAALRARIDAGDATARAELQYLDCCILKRAQREEAEFPPHTALDAPTNQEVPANQDLPQSPDLPTTLDLQTYVDRKRPEIDALDLSMIPQEFVQAARDYAAQHPDALPIEILSKVYLDEAGNNRTTGDPAIDEQLQALVGAIMVAAYQCGMLGGTAIGLDDAHPQGDLYMGLVAWNTVALMLLEKMGY